MPTPHGNTKYDWLALQADYLTGKFTHAQLAAKHNVKLCTLNTRIQRYGWAKARSEAKHGLEVEIIQDCQDTILRQRKEWTAQILHSVKGHKIALDLTTIRTLKDRQIAVNILKTCDDLVSKRLGMDLPNHQTIFNVIALSNLSDKSETP